MSRITTLLSATAIATMAAMPALAQPNLKLHFPWWPPHPPKQYHRAPGPEAGIGLPVLAAIGGYVYYARRKRRRAKEE
jgi:hypothetical protein